MMLLVGRHVTLVTKWAYCASRDAELPDIRPAKISVVPERLFIHNQLHA
jgi:hypothetical protein